MALTPLAESLRSPLERALSSLDRLATVGAFEPSSASRTSLRIVLIRSQRSAFIAGQPGWT